MDPALLRERAAFQKKALSLPSVEKRKVPAQPTQPSKKPKPSQPREPRPFDYKQSAGSSSFKFSVLAKIINYMKSRHQEGDTHPLTIEEILDETNQLDIGTKMRHWLASEALPNNPKIDVKDGDKFIFKPPYNIPNKKKLLRLLDKNDQEGLGGLLLADVEESMPNAAKGLKALGDSVLYITGVDKKQVLFYNDKSTAFSVDEEFRKLWRGVAVEGIDERKIEEHLQKHGIASMQDLGVKKIPKRKKGGNVRRGKNRPMKTHNVHMGDILEDYSNSPSNKPTK